jgi:hypothetical protein
MQHFKRSINRVEKSIYWIHSAAGWRITHPAGARVRTPAYHPEHKVSKREIPLG